MDPTCHQLIKNDAHAPDVIPWAHRVFKEQFWGKEKFVNSRDLFVKIWILHINEHKHGNVTNSQLHSLQSKEAFKYYNIIRCEKFKYAIILVETLETTENLEGDLAQFSFRKFASNICKQV